MPDDIDAPEPDGFLNPDEGDETPEDVEEPAEEPEDEPDPVLSRIEAIEAQFKTLSGLDPNKINPALGRIAAIQSKLDALEKQPAPAAQDTSQYDAGLQKMARVLLNSPLVDDRDKADVQGIIDALSAAGSERERQRLRDELLAEVRQTASDVTQEPDSDDDVKPWVAATQTVSKIAARRGIDMDSIPREVWAVGRATGDPDEAVAHLVAWMDEQREESQSAERTVNRRRAAGTGTPSRTGALSYSNIDDAEDAFNAGELDFEAYKRIREQLGVKTP